MCDIGHRILDSITSPADLKVLDNSELQILAREIREQIIETTSKSGGHVASSLGAVEIILAVHSLIDAPRDKFVFDVGHQSYAHKLVTGRLDRFDTIRTFHGLSGFPRPSESEYDVHPSGHASDSLSVASGLALARQMAGTDEKIVALIGDAALSGGMAFEALNFIGSQQLQMVIILNDNEMSISRNVGALMKHLGNIRATSQYRDVREAIQYKLERGGRMSNAFAELGKRTKESMKQMFIPESMIYEQMNIVCTPPIDGHDIGALREMLQLVLPMNGPVLVHVVTKKGAGYPPAERDTERFHGTGPYDIATGKPIATNPGSKTYTQVFGSALVREAERDERVVAITAAMEGGCGLKSFKQAFPDRFVDVGIAEEQAIGMAAGLAIAGKKPVAAIYSTFMQRAIDQMIVDVALPKLDVVFALDRAGLVGDDGPTHHGVFDLVYLRMVPNMKIIVPSGEKHLCDAVHTAISMRGPIAIRYPRGSAEYVSYDPEREPKLLEEGKSHLERAGDDVAILAFGRMVKRAVEAAELLEAYGISCRVVDMIWAKPFDVDAVRKAAQTRLVVTIEEGVITGGVGEGILAKITEEGLDVPVLILGLPDEFILQGKSDLLFENIGLDAQGIAHSIKEKLALSEPDAGKGND